MLFQTCFGLYSAIREIIHTHQELLPALHVYHTCVSYETHKFMIQSYNLYMKKLNVRTMF